MRQLRSDPKRSSDVTRQAPLGASCISTKREWGTNRPDMYKRCCALKECNDKLELKVTDAPSTVLPGTMVHYSAGESSDVGELMLHPAEVEQSTDKERQHDDGGDDQQIPGQFLLTEQCPAKAFDDSDHRVQSVQKPPAVWNDRAGISHRR